MPVTKYKSGKRHRKALAKVEEAKKVTEVRRWRALPHTMHGLPLNTFFPLFFPSRHQQPGTDASWEKLAGVKEAELENLKRLAQLDEEDNRATVRRQRGQEVFYGVQVRERVCGVAAALPPTDVCSSAPSRSCCTTHKRAATSRSSTTSSRT